MIKKTIIFIITIASITFIVFITNIAFITIIAIIAFIGFIAVIVFIHFISLIAVLSHNIIIIKNACVWRFLLCRIFFFCRSANLQG